MAISYIAVPVSAAAELQSQHLFDASFTRDRWDVVLHSRFRGRPEGTDLFQFRTGPIVEYGFHPKASVIGGYYFTRNEGRRGGWSTTHRLFGGAELVLAKRPKMTVDSRTLVERFVQPDTDFNRYRQRFRVARSGSGPYASWEALLDRQGWRSARYSGGWRLPSKGALSLDLAYFYETRRPSEGNRHMVITTIHFRPRTVRVDSDP